MERFVILIPATTPKAHKLYPAFDAARKRMKLPTFFKTEAEAQKVCDELRKELSFKVAVYPTLVSGGI